jgi:hypothetical protein
MKLTNGQLIGLYTVIVLLAGTVLGRFTVMPEESVPTTTQPVTTPVVTTPVSAVKTNSVVVVEATTYPSDKIWGAKELVYHYNNHLASFQMLLGEIITVKGMMTHVDYDKDDRGNVTGATLFIKGTDEFMGQNVWFKMTNETDLRIVSYIEDGTIVTGRGKLVRVSFSGDSPIMYGVELL